MSSPDPNRRTFLRTLAAVGASTALLARAEDLLAEGVSRPLLDPVTPGSDRVERLREQYMLSSELIYLNHASIGTVPRSVHRAHSGYLELCESFPSLYVWGAVWREVTEETRRSAASLLGCDPDDLAITHNTTEGFNVLAHGLPVGAGDEVLFSSLNHPGASVPWQGMAARRGFTVRTFAFPVEHVPSLTVEEVVAIHVDALRPETRVLVLPHIDNMVGLRHPLAEISAAVRARGVEFVVVDGAQSAGMIPVELGAAGVDAYSMSPHKWLQAPKGLGLLYVSSALRDRLPRMWYRTSGDRIRASARKYEDYSTRAWPGVVALGDAIAFQRSIGTAEKERRYAHLRRLVHERCAEDPALTWRSAVDPALSSVLMAVRVRGARASGLVGPLLADHGAVVRGFAPPLDTVRISPNVATTDAELGTFLDAISARAL